MKLFSLLTLAACASAQTAMTVPSIGVMLDAAGLYRPVYGIAGNFTLGAPIEAIDSAVLDSLPSTAGAVLRTTHGTVYTDGEHLILRRPDASEIRIALTGAMALRSMSADWVQVSTSTGNFAFHLEPGHEALFTLPGAARAEVRRR